MGHWKDALSHSQQPSLQVWPSLHSSWRSLVPQVYRFSWRAFPSVDIIHVLTHEYQTVNMQSHSVKMQKKTRTRDNFDTPFLPPGIVTPGPGISQECLRCCQQHLPYFSGHIKHTHTHTQAQFVQLIWQSDEEMQRQLTFIVSKTSDNLTQTLMEERGCLWMIRCVQFQCYQLDLGTNTALLLGKGLFVRVVAWFHAEVQSSWKVLAGHCYFYKINMEPKLKSHWRLTHFLPQFYIDTPISHNFKTSCLILHRSL